MDTKKLRQKILDLAIHGKLVPQDPNDEPASVLLERIRAEKEQLIKEGKIKAPKKSKSAGDTSHYGKEGPWALPEGWVWTTLDELAIYKKGPFGSSLTKAMFVPDSVHSYKVYEQKNAISKDASIGHYFINEDKFKSMSSFEVFPGDTIVSCAGTIGETYTLPQGVRKGIINQALMIVRLFYQTIRPYYLLYFDYFLKTQAEKDSKGTAIKNIPPFEVLKSYQIPLPPLAEQKRIIDTCETFFNQLKIIDDGRYSLQLRIDTIRNTILSLAIHGKLVPQDPSDEPAIELLKRINPNFKPSDNLHYEGELPKGWCFSTIGDLFQHNTGKALNGKDQTGEELRYITTSNLYWDRFDLNEVRIMPFTEAEKEKCRATKGDLLVCEGGDIGRAAIWPYDYDVMIQNHIHRLRPKGKLSVRFYYYIFLLYKQMGLIGGKGIAILGLSSRELDKMVVPVPPVQEQHRIVSVIEGLFTELDALTNSLS